jgi:mRNA interferase MazF
VRANPDGALTAALTELLLQSLGPKQVPTEALTGMRGIDAAYPSADPLNESRAGVVIVVPCTATRRGLPSHVEIEPGGSGLDDVSYAKCEDVKSVSDARLVTRLGSVVDETLFSIARALRFLLDL